MSHVPNVSCVVGDSLNLLLNSNGWTKVLPIKFVLEALYDIYVCACDIRSAVISYDYTGYRSGSR